jgi:hypothetical protein
MQPNQQQQQQTGNGAVSHEEDKPQQHASAVMQLVRQTHTYHKEGLSNKYTCL